jgi:hypothetical protein
MTTSLKLAYYTCFFGGQYNSAKVIGPIPSQTTPCYYFTNNTDMYNALENTLWIRIFVDNVPIHNCPIQDSMETKLLRTCPHKFEQLKDYEYLCWFDNNLQVYENKVHEVISKLDEDDSKTIVLTKHSYSDTFTSVWDEFNLAMQYSKYASQKEQNMKYINNQLTKGFSEKINVHFCSGWNIRKMCKLTEEFAELLYEHIQECGIECQISLSFVQQKYIGSIFILDHKETWKYFYE